MLFLANDVGGTYMMIIIASILVVLSFIYNIIAKRTNIPSVLMLIATGILLKQGLQALHYEHVDLMPVLEILGIVGLIMIVLEAALDLELNKEKMPMIGKSMIIALICLVGSTLAIGLLLQQFIEMDNLKAMLYATPLSIMSSAIIIPSVSNLTKNKKEFMVYESTFSDILGIMFFYFLINLIESGGTAAGTQFGISFVLTMIVAVVASYLLVFFFKDMQGHKLFLLISVLLLLYALGKLLHLSPLLIILVFGMAMSNHQLFFKMFKNDFAKDDPIEAIEKDFHMITAETAFVVRTFFFVIFGMTIDLAALVDGQVFLVSMGILVCLYVIRWVVLKLFLKDGIFPELWIAPRGLITILLFFAIPASLQVSEFSSGILLYVILISSLLMSFGLIKDGRNRPKVKVVEPEDED